MQVHTYNCHSVDLCAPVYLSSNEPPSQYYPGAKDLPRANPMRCRGYPRSFLVTVCLWLLQKRRACRSRSIGLSQAFPHTPRPSWKQQPFISMALPSNVRPRQVRCLLISRQSGRSRPAHFPPRCSFFLSRFPSTRATWVAVTAGRNNIFNVTIAVTDSWYRGVLGERTYATANNQRITFRYNSGPRAKYQGWKKLTHRTFSLRIANYTLALFDKRDSLAGKRTLEICSVR